MTLPDAVREAVEAHVETIDGRAILADVRRRQAKTAKVRRWGLAGAALTTAVAVVFAVVAVRTGGDANDIVVARDVTATAEQRGIRVELAIDRADVRVGETVRARGRVTNTTDTAVLFGGGSCDAPESQPNIKVDLRPGQPRGRTWEGALAEFKQRALENTPYRSAFSQDASPEFCASYLRTWELTPGQVFSLDAAWEAKTPLGAAYDGTAEVAVQFTFWTAARQETPHEAIARLALRVTGGDPARLSPAAAVDAALGDAAFAAFVGQHPPSAWQQQDTGGGVADQPFYEDPTSGKLVHGEVWLVYLQPAKANATRASVVVHPSTGAILRRDIPQTPNRPRAPDRG